ncbi:hypothetical protein FXO38_10389 [Capsicum annuum]|nr:hypothetical protein FXO38_10389 [Capsicum annuum]
MLPLTTAPPDPPDQPLNDDTTMEDTTVHKLSFKDILTDRPQELNQSYNTLTFTPAPQLPYAKLNKEESKTTTLHGGPWFIVGGFLSVIAWKPNFVPSTSTITHTVILVEYDGDDVLCVGCSHGKPHSENLYLHSTPTNDGTPTLSAINVISIPMTDKEEDMWKLVSFPKRRTQKNNSTDQVRDSVAKPRKDKAQNPNPGSSVDHKLSQTIKNRFNGLNENILEEKNVQYTTIDDETLKVMSIKPHASPEGSTHIMDTLNFFENSSNVAPNAYDMTMEVIYLNSNLTNLSSPFKNGKNYLTPLNPVTIKIHMDNTQQPFTPKNPFFLVTAPPPQEHSPTSWLELLLQDFPLTLNACIGDQPVILTLQDPYYLAYMVKKAMNRSVKHLGNQL